MTQTETEAPQFKAADEQVAYEDLSWFRRILRKYTNSFSVARSSLFWALLRREKKTLKWLFIVMIIYTAGLLQVTNLTRGMIDNGIVNQVAPLWDYLRYITFWALWALVFSLAQQQIADRLAYQIEFDMRVWLYTHIQSADLRRLDQVATGQLVTRSLTDIQLVDTLLKTFPQLIGYAPILLSVAIIVTIINPIMGVLSILALPINVWLVNKFRSRLRALSWAELNERAEVTTAIDEPVRGIRVVKAFGREDQERERVARVTERAFRFAMTRTRLLAGYDIYLRMMPLLVQAGLLGAGAYLMSNGSLSVGTFFFAFQIGQGLSQFSSAFGEIASAWQYLRSAQDRIAEMLALSARPVTDGRMIPLPSTGLELRGVEVTYGNRRFLHGLDVQVRPGELVVVSGPPGCGKTTLAGIASGLIDADSGVASLDGIALDDLDPAQLRQTIRVVSEEPLLLAATLRDNLLLGAWGEIDDDAMVDAMRTAGAEEVIGELGGLDGVVGDRGLTVSGGQRQRVSLARALVAQPRVLILDDALSAVHPALEIEIMKRVHQYLPQTAILYITRRTGLAALANRVDHARARGDGELGPPSSLQNEMLDPVEEDLVSSEIVGAIAGGDPIEVADAVEQVGMKTEIADGTLQVDVGSDRRPRRARPDDRQARPRAAGHQRRDAHPCRHHRRRIEAAVLEDREAVPRDDGRGLVPGPALRDRRNRPGHHLRSGGRRRRGEQRRRRFDCIPLGAVGRGHRRRRRLHREVLPDLCAAVQPEPDRRAPPSRLLPLEQVGRELLRPRAPGRCRHACGRRPRPDPDVRGTTGVPVRRASS